MRLKFDEAPNSYYITAYPMEEGLNGGFEFTYKMINTDAVSNFKSFFYEIF